MVLIHLRPMIQKLYYLLKLLSQNSTESSLKLAKKIGISPATVQKRVEKMKKDGIILGTSAMFDLSLLGYQGKAFFFIKYSICADPNGFKKFVLRIPNVFLFANIIGEFDVLAMIVFKDNSEIKEISDRFRANSCVKQVKVAVTTDTFYPVKEEYLNNVTRLLQL